jgi:hypothetical protein
MSEFEIEEGIPIPGRKAGITVETPWPWPDMDVDQSVFVPAKKGENASNIRERVTPHQYGRKSDKKFKTRWMKHNGKFGIRVWRVA